MVSPLPADAIDEDYPRSQYGTHRDTLNELL